MRSRIFGFTPVGLLFVSAVACTTPVEPTEGASEGTPELLTSCPAATSQDAQMRSAATVAFDLMKLSADGQVNKSNAFWVYSILASQRYRVDSAGKTIEFDPSDPLYGYVTNAMKGKLAVAQLDASVGQFLVDGIRYAYSTTDGWQYPSIPAAQGLDDYKYPGPTSAPLLDHSAGDSVVITGQAWCKTSMVVFNQTCKNSHNYAPLIMHDIRDWRSTPPSAFTGKAHRPTSPFNGPTAAGNPYLIVSVNGKTTTWAGYDFAGTDCYTLPNSTCTGTLMIDPVPYAEPGDYYNTTGIVGTQANPYSLNSTTLYAVPEHADQWATRTVGGNQQWGTFSTAVSVFGVTVYKYSKKY